MPEEDGVGSASLDHVESGHGDDAGTTERAIWRHLRLPNHHEACALSPHSGTGCRSASLVACCDLLSQNFFAIIPLAPSIAVTTRKVADRVGAGFGDLLNVILGNAVEIIVRTRSVIRDLFHSLTSFILTLARHYCCDAKTN
jgi:hypothetical protein